MSHHSSTPARARPPKVKRPPEAVLGKRERILDAAVKIFAAEGFYGAKVSQIADAAGVADGTIYLYFKSKDELLISLFEDRMDRVLETLRKALASGGSALDRLRRIMELHLELIEANPEMGEVITVELRQSAKFVREYQNAKFGEFLRLIADEVAEGQRAGELRADLDPQLVSRALFGALDEVALSWIVRPLKSKNGVGRGRPRGELSSAAKQLSAIFLEGLRAPLTGARSK